MMNRNLTDKDLHKLFKKYGANAREWLRKCALLLPEIDRRKIWRRHGCGSVYEYAAKLAGMSHASVRDALWVASKIEDKPALRKLAEEKGLARVKPVANLATPETEEFWAEKARDMSQNTLRVYVRGLKEQEVLHVVNREDLWVNPQSQPEKVKVSVEMDAKLAERFEQFKKRADFEEQMRKFLNVVEKEESADAELAKKSEAVKPEAIKTDSRHIPVKIQRFVAERTGGLCFFPGCVARGKIFHHTQRFALEKVHDPDRIVLLCEAHERMAHLGLIENEDGVASEWSLRKEPDRNDAKWLVDQQVWLRRT